MDIEDIWRIREEDVYPRLFGQSWRGIFPLSQELFARSFVDIRVDPNWLFFGVFEFAPTADRPSWLYVTSGHSNPSEDATDGENESGAGVEFTLQVSEQGDWAIRTLQSLLAADLVLRSGQIANGQPMSPYAHVRLHAPINGVQTCQIRNLVCVKREDGPSMFMLPSGEVQLLGFTGVTDSELAFAKSNGSLELVEKLQTAGFHPITDPHRKSIL